MHTFGQKLKATIEEQGLDNEQVASSTGLDIRFLEALERDDYRAIPDDESVTRGLVAFAKLMDVDPELVIEDFHRQREESLRLEIPTASDAAEPPTPTPPRSAAPAAPSPVASGPTSAAEPAQTPEPRRHVVAPGADTERSGGFPVGILAGAAAVVLAGAAIWWMTSSDTTPTAPETPIADTATAEPVTAAEQPAPAQTEATPADPAPRTAAPVEPARQAPAPGRDRQERTGRDAEYHAGTGRVRTGGVHACVLLRHLHLPFGRRHRRARPRAGRGHRPVLGGRPRLFWTSVEGARSGQSIDHVWLHDGQEKLRIALKLGGARWRTQSYKNLHPGSTGTWVAEARDAAGNVLARQTFRVTN